MSRRKSLSTSGLLVDASTIIRLSKCDVLHVLTAIGPKIVVADQVDVEIRRDTEDAARIKQALAYKVEPVRIGSAAYDAYCRLGGADVGNGTQDMGELESVALAVAARDAGNVVPFATTDTGAARIATLEKVVVLDFRDVLSLAWNGAAIDAEEAARIEARATVTNGWKPPAGESPDMAVHGPVRVRAITEAIAAASAAHKNRKR